VPPRTGHCVEVAIESVAFPVTLATWLTKNSHLFIICSLCRSSRAHIHPHFFTRRENGLSRAASAVPLSFLQLLALWPLSFPFVMTFFQPAVRAHQAKRHPALDVGREPPTTVSPGARRDHHLYHEFDENDSLTLFTTTILVPTTVVTDVPASDIGDTPTPITVVETLTSVSVVTVLVPGGLSLSGPVPSSTPPAATGIPSSLSSPSPISTLTTTPEMSSPVPQSPVSGSTTATSGTSSADALLDGDAKNSSGLSGGVIAAIVISLVLALCAMTFFVLRRRQIRRRIARRVTWTPNLAPQPNFDSLEKGTSDAPIEVASQSSKEGGNGHEKVPSPVRNIARKPPLPYSPVSPTAPSQTRSNSPDARAPSVRSASVSVVTSTPTQEMSALVRMTFIPQLPDELAITPGETLYIQTEYDDGWAFCVNAGGKDGMVPLECLEGGQGQFAGLSHLRTMRRASSLRSAASWT
jgi:hypothetical protein